MPKLQQIDADAFRRVPGTVTIDIETPSLNFMGKRAFQESFGTIKIRIDAPDQYLLSEQPSTSLRFFASDALFDEFDGEIVIEMPDCRASNVPPGVKPFCRHICEAHQKLKGAAELCCTRYVG